MSSQGSAGFDRRGGTSSLSCVISWRMMPAWRAEQVGREWDQPVARFQVEIFHVPRRRKRQIEYGLRFCVKRQAGFTLESPVRAVSFGSTLERQRPSAQGGPLSVYNRGLPLGVIVRCVPSPITLAVSTATRAVAAVGHPHQWLCANSYVRGHRCQ